MDKEKTEPKTRVVPQCRGVKEGEGERKSEKVKRVKKKLRKRERERIGDWWEKSYKGGERLAKDVDVDRGYEQQSDALQVNSGRVALTNPSAHHQALFEDSSLAWSTAVCSSILVPA